MSECHICGEYSEDLHPVEFKPPVPTEIEHLVDWEGLGLMDDLEVAEHEDERWNTRPYICEKCFRKYYRFISWWG